MTTTRRSYGDSRELSEEELIEIQVYNNLSEECKFLYQNVELQKKIYSRVNGLFWFFISGAVFTVICYVIQSGMLK